MHKLKIEPLRNMSRESRDEILKSWELNRDFVVVSLGTYYNKVIHCRDLTNLKAEGYTHIEILFNRRKNGILMAIT